MWVIAVILLGGVALSPFGFAAHNWYTGWKWRRDMRREWERDVNANRWGDVRRSNETGDTLH